MLFIPIIALLLVISQSCSSYQLVPANSITDPGTGTFEVNESNNRIR